MTAFDNGYTNAMRVTLVLPIAVMGLAAVSVLLVKRRTPGAQPAAAAPTGGAAAPAGAPTGQPTSEPTDISVD